MQHLKILNNREVKPILKFLKENFGMEGKLDYVFFKSSKDKVYVLSKKFAEFDEKTVRINNIGLYFGKQEKDGFRLSIEGAQLIRPKKNVVDVGKEQMGGWMRGEDIEVEHDSNVYVIVMYGKDIYGCGKYKDCKILNAVSKQRRVSSVSK